MEELLKGKAVQPKGKAPKLDKEPPLPSSVFPDFAYELEPAHSKGKKRAFLVLPNSNASKEQCTLYIKAENSWLLEHHSPGSEESLTGQWFPRGQYRLTFTSHSKSLDAVLIDPDPSGGLGTTKP